MNWLISYPRSGNTAARYIIEMLTKKPTNGVCYNAPLNEKDILQKPLLHEGDDYAIRKNHDFRGVKSTDFVLFIVRDYLEAIIRHNEKRGLTEANMKAWIDDWFSLLQAYDKHPGSKMLIHYDQLIKIAEKESLEIYPNPKSNGPHYHKAKLGDMVEGLNRYAQKYSEFIERYL